MKYWTIPVRNHEGCGSSSEDQYHQLKTERDELARKWNDTNESNRLLRTKCSRLQAIDRSNRIVGVPDKIQPDYDDLFKAYDKLQREHRALTTKHKSSIQLIGKLRNEIQTLKLRCAVPRQSISTSARSKPIVCRGSGVSDQGNTNFNKENLINDQLQLRLNNAETQLQMFRRESVDAASKTQELRQLQSQHEEDVSKMKAQAEKLDKILYLHKEYQAKHRKLKEELHRCEEVNETLESRIAELEDCEEQVGELRNHNRFLEKKVRELSTLSRPMDERDRYDRRLLLRQIEDTRNECDALMEENKVLRQKNLPLYPASNGEIATSKRELSNSPTDCRASPNLCDVWQQLDRAQQRCIQKDNELRQANNLLQAQVASNLTIRSEQGDSIAKLRRRLIAQECKTEDLSLKASRRLQQIRALESQFTKLHLNTRLGSSMEVTVHSAALHSLGKDTKSFLLLGFHPFASELSNIVSGREPAYDLRVTYELDDTKLSQWNVEVEIYVLNDASPRLFAHASVPMTTLLTSSASTQPLSLDLLREGGDGRVGKVNMSIRFHQPTPTDCPIPNDTMAIMECTGRKRTIKDAIYVSVMSVTLSNQLLFDDQSVFFVHYRLLSNGGVTTDSKMANIKGIITFNHKSSFSIVSTDEGCLEPILEEISKGTIQFTLLSIRKEDSTGDDTDVEDFHVVGEAKVPLTNIWNDVVELSTKLISLDEAKIVGSMGLSFVTTVKPRLPGSLRSTVHPSLMAMLTGVLSTIGEGESKTVSTIRLLQFIDPPEGIMETATILQRELRSNQLQGRSLSATLSLPPDEQFMSPSDLQRCSDAAHKKSLLAHIPPSDEMEDLYQYLSNSDSLICIRELDYFVASDSLKRLAYACRLLRGMNACIREDLLHNNVFGGRVDTFYDTMSVPELSEYYAKVLEGRSEVDLIRLASLLSEPSHPK